MQKKNLVFVDVETTGLDPDIQEVIQIGCVVVSQEWSADGKPEFKMIEEFELKIKPINIAVADKVALRINGYNETDWVFAYDLKQAMEIFAKKTADCIMIGHNVCFDFMFIDKAFKKSGVENKMHYHKLDTISIAFAKLHSEGDADRFSLNFLCEYFKIENKKAHTALSDSRATFEVYKKLMSM